MCCRINSSLFIRSPLPPSSPEHWQDTATPDAYAGKAQHRLPRTHPISLTLSITSYPPALSLTHCSQMSLIPFSPCSRASMFFSLNSSVSLVLHIAAISVSCPSSPSSHLVLCCCTPPHLSHHSLLLILSLSLSYSIHSYSLLPIVYYQLSTVLYDS